MKKILLLLLILFTCTACQDYVEINDFAIISGIIIDYKDDKYEMISELLINEEDTKVKTFQTSGKSIDECLSEISKEDLRLAVNLIFGRKSLIMIVAQGSNQVHSDVAGQCEEADWAGNGSCVCILTWKLRANTLLEFGET